MLSWGIISGLFAFIGPISAVTGISNEWVFYILRFLLGIAEAGFFPGIIFYLTLWFPSVYRARVVALFMLAIPFSSIIGAPISGALLNITGAGLDGWQWLFILEAVPSVLMGFGVIFYLTDRPAHATWLREDERTWLEERLDAERHKKEAAEHLSIWQGAQRPARPGLRLRVFLPERGELRRRLLPADHRQGLRRQQLPDRPARRAALRVRRDRDGAARAATPIAR